MTAFEAGIDADDQQTQGQSCKVCRFWTTTLGNCRRRAPVSIGGDDQLYDIAVAIKLLVWWAMREWSDQKTADEQMKTFLINVEGEWSTVIWPHTNGDDWCGEWEGRL